MKYITYWVGGERDGEILGTFDTESEAEKFARKFESKHEGEFDPTCGGVAVEEVDE